MFEHLVSFSLRNRLAVVFFACVVGVFGVVSFQKLTIEAFPDPTDTQVNVITLFDGQPTEEVERQLGLPLERALNGTPNMTRLRNLSMFGLSMVTLTFRDGTDGLWARQQVLERLREAELPEGVSPQLGPYATPIGEVYRYTLEGAKGDPMKLRTLQDWVVRPSLMRVNGVADVVSYGGLQKVIHVEPRPQSLAGFGLTLQDLEEAVQRGSQNASGGVLERGTEQFVIRSEGLFKSLDDLRNVGVAARDGTPVFVKDVATVSEGWAPRQGVVSRGENADVVEGIVLMRRGENPSAVLERLKEQLTGLNLQLAEDGVRVSPFYDRRELVDATLETVARNLVEGAVLVLLVLFVFLLDLRAALIVCTLIPLSLAVAFIYLQQRGMSANLLSMGAVDFGVIVDGGVVIIEAILAALMLKDHDSLPTQERIRRAASAVVRPTVFALLIIIAAYLPIFMLERVEGRIFSPMANTVAAALAGALLFSVTLVPALASYAYDKPFHHRESPVLRWAQRLYLPTLRFSLRRPKLVLGLAAVLLCATGVVGSRLGSEFLPELNEGALYMTFTLPSNVSLSEGRRIAPKLNALISAQPQVEAVLSQLGRPEDGTDATLTSNLEFFVKLKPASQWPKETPDLGDVIAALHKSIEEVPGLEVNFSQPIRDNVNESISGQFGQIAVKLYGDDLVALQQQAERVKAVISTVEGVADLGIVKSGEVPQLRVIPDRQALARYGMTLGDFQHVFQTAVGGRPVDEFWEGERRFDVVLRLPTTERDDVEKLGKLRMAVEGGVTVPLEAVAQLSTSQGRASITRENGRRYIGLRMNVRDRDLGGFVDQARARVEAEAPLQPGQRLEWGGEFENKERAMSRLLQVVPMALLLTLLLLFKAFDSFPRAVLTLLNVPFALTGGVFGLSLAGMPLSVAAAVGFIALIGQASLNGVLVSSAIAERIRKGEVLEHAILEGARERLRPVLMTAALAALGLVPAAMSRAMGSETQRPLAVVIVFGTLSACVLTLVLLPVMYLVYARRFERT
ncbi:MAG: CusA/CzcA family heavy metal efflux RND transporter [Archangium sp.]|nr:CusA/CzcA family heavy metal efflux RND transporter [Archangium sp.]MDP3152226.1 CusA/CzcA family heavy metal efflux RND transporter [Archangium sp.]MDP3571071.1 CusA/CzcA family heavy metal efflux RND transporter [Archangium sp.]